MASEIRTILKTCSTCKQSFDSLRELIAHEKIHCLSEETPKNGQLASNSTFNKGFLGLHRCEHCGKTFISRSGYQAHKRTFHSDREKEVDTERVETKFEKIRPQTVGQTEFSASAWTTVVKTEPMDNDSFANNSGTMESGNAKSEPVDSGQSGTIDSGGFKSEPVDENQDQKCSENGTQGEKDHRESIDREEEVGRQGPSLRRPLRLSTSVVIKFSQEKDEEDAPKTVTRFSCEYCLATFSRNKNVDRHQRICHPKKQQGMYFCSKCPKASRRYFNNKTVLLAHVAEEHDTETVLFRKSGAYLHCKYCSATFPCKWKLHRHQTALHPNKERRYICSKCPNKASAHRYFNSEKELLKHMKEKHEGKKKRRKKCSNARKLTTQSRATRSFSIRESVSHFVCSYCLSLIYSLDILRKHEITYHLFGERRTYYCSKCPRLVRPYFSDEQELLAHAAQKHPELEINKKETSSTSKMRGTESTFVWTTTVLKTKIIDNEHFDDDSEPMDVANVKMEPSEDCRDAETPGQNDQDAAATTSGSAVGSTDVNVDEDNSHYFCQLVATSLRRLDRQTKRRVQADIKRIFQMAADGQNWILINDDDAFNE